jgi:hypothetical protein
MIRLAQWQPGCATLAQLVERLTRNEKVAGSIPAGGSILHCHSNMSHKRVSYNGYYVAFPRLRRGFDSRHPHHVIAVEI